MEVYAAPKSCDGRVFAVCMGCLKEVIQVIAATSYVIGNFYPGKAIFWAGC